MTLHTKADYAVVLIYWMGKGQEQIGYAPIYAQTGSRIVSSNTTGTYSGYGNFGDYSLPIRLSPNVKFMTNFSV